MRLQLWRERKCEVEIDLDQPIELGRQKIHEPEPFAVVEGDGFCRCIIAHHTENTISRKQLRIELQGSSLLVSNLNSKRSFELDDETVLQPNEEVLLDPFSSFRFLDFEIKVLGQISYQSLPNQTLAPGQLSGLGEQLQSLHQDQTSDSLLTQQQLINWLSKAMLVLQDAATSPRFLRRAAEVVREIVDLSSAAVLVRDGDRWETVAISSDSDVLDADSDSSNHPDSWQPSRTIVDLVAREKRTFFNLCEQTASVQSLMGVKAIVASPILSGDNEVIGILYGDRRSNTGTQVDEAEAVLVEVLATGVAAGLARVAQEEKAIRARADFERSFGHELMHHLEENPHMLEGRVEEITLMFCDVTGFSAASEQLGPAKTMTWIGEVMRELHECVIENQGVVIDYVGDELIAMWGAPAPQSNHAELACRTAMTIVDRLNQANSDNKFLMPASVRTGINTGLAHVGDTGTTYRMKYGAMGDAVNLASRIQGATKFFGCQTLISKETREQLDESIICRRIGKVKVINIARTIELYELLPPQSDSPMRPDFEKALQCMESGEYDSATGLIQKLAKDFPSDVPTQVLRKRIDEMRTDDEQTDQQTTDLIWELPNK